MAGKPQTAERIAVTKRGHERRRQDRIAKGELVSNRPLRARYHAVHLWPGYGITEIAERAGMISPSGKADGTHVKRLLGLERTAPSVKKGVRYEGHFVDYISYEKAVLLCRALDMLPVEAGI